MVNRNSRFSAPWFQENFPAPWSVEVIEGGFRVVDANGVPLAYCYARDDLAKISSTPALTTDEARRIAANIAKLPDLLKRGESE